MERQSDRAAVKADETGWEEAKKKASILKQVKELPGPIKEVLEHIGLAQSTYYGWSKKYKEEGLEGLRGGSPVSEEVWNKFDGVVRKHGRPAEGDTKGKVKEKDVMGNTEGQDKRKEILFRRFGDDASKAGGGRGEDAGAGGGTIPPEPAGCEPPSDEPMDKTVKYVIGVFAFVVAILLAASFSNSAKYYFETNKQMLELWKGRFAPMGEVKVATFADPKIIEGLPEKDAYTKEEAFGALFDYLINEADKVLDTERTPDLKSVKSYLAHAAKYAVSEADREAIRMRRNSIDFLVLSGKADLALTKGQEDNFEAAKEYLSEALDLASTEIHKGIVKKRLSAIDYALNAWKAGEREKSLIELYREYLAKSLEEDGSGGSTRSDSKMFGEKGSSAALTPALVGATDH